MAPAAAVFLVVMSASARPPPATESILVRIDWDAPAGCADPDAFLADIQARSDRVRRADPHDDAVRVEVHLTRAAAKIHGELRLVDDDGKTELRKVDGSSCDEVAEALSLTAALALGSSARWSLHKVTAGPAAGPGSFAETTTSTSTASSPASPPTRAAPSLVPAPPAASPSTSAAPGSETRSERVPTRAVPEVGPADTTETAAGRPPRDPSRALALSIGLGAVAAEIVSPYLNVGGALSSRLAFRSVDGHELSLGVTVLHARNDWLASSPAVAVRWTAIALTACPGWGLGATLIVEVCGIGFGGWLVVAEQAVTVRREVERSWWSAGGVVRLRAALAWGLRLQLDAVAHVPLVGRHFVTSTPDVTVGESPTVAGMLGLVIAREL